MENINDLNTPVTSQPIPTPPKSNTFKYLFIVCLIVLLASGIYSFFLIKNLNSKLETKKPNITELIPTVIPTEEVINEVTPITTITPTNIQSFNEITHIIGNFGYRDPAVSIYNDGTLSLNGKQKIVDGNNNIIKMSKMFHVMRRHNNIDCGDIDFYFITQDSFLMKFSPNTVCPDLATEGGTSNTLATRYNNKIVLNIESEYYPTEYTSTQDGKKYPGAQSKVIITYKDGSKETFIQSSDGYYDLSQQKVIIGKRVGYN